MRSEMGDKPLYLRVSVTDGCAFRCPYCQPESPVGLLQKSERMTREEISRSVKVLAQLGVTRVRLTGGEPLSRPDLGEIVRSISKIQSIHDVSLTTNGERLGEQASALAAAGLKRVNIHIDSLRAQRYASLTGRNILERVLAGVDAAIRAGLAPIKVNVVLMKGINDDELHDFCQFAIEKQVSVRFIELMNTGPARDFVKEHFFSAVQAREKIGERYKLAPRFDTRGASPAREYGLDGGAGTIGFIASESEPFCESCNRLRLTAQGCLKVCLYDPGSLDVRALLRSEGLSQAALLDALSQAIRGKRSHHPAFGETGEQPFSMAGVGG